MLMEFWGIEVKPGVPLKVKPDHNKLIHMSQAALGEVKNDKGNDSIPLRLNIDTGKFVIGILSAENTPQLTFDLVFEREFELSHDWKNGSVYFCGYTADNPFAEDEDVAGKLEPRVDETKPAKFEATAVKPESSAKSTVTLVAPKKDTESDDDEGEDSGEPIEDSSASEEDTEEAMGQSDEFDDDSSDDEDEEILNMVELAKKRPSESAIKETPVSAKKAKLDTPQKTDGKKGGGHTATQSGKTPANSNKSKEQTPKSSGIVSCKSCSKTFNSEKALQSHTKAKHDGK